MVDIKETVKAMCKALPGGRSAMAGGLGMTLAHFNNNLYEKNGCRFFEHHELEAMEDLSGTSLLAEYFSQRRGGMHVDIPAYEELDQVCLFEKGVRTAANRGHVDQIIEKSLEDGVITQDEADEIMTYHNRHISAREDEVRSIVRLYSKSLKAGKK
ncbi:YmfL family putative regulatory protein [Rouxiella sp. WC2420]|uniref:YmfL family putative regulatory protein n=1 Tax=Rouxiella sp. WC2420 TaxID=3234145 RepID=A0AB39VMC8_9GAMM